MTVVSRAERTIDHVHPPAHRLTAAPRLEVPTVDLSGWRTGSRSTRETIARQFDRAARSVGFVQVVGHGISPAAIAGMTSAVDQFFGLPLATKQRYTASRGVDRGYGAPAPDAAAGLLEAFTVGATAGEVSHLELDPASDAANIWPDAVPAFERHVTAWFREVAALARTFESVFELALGLPDGYFGPVTDRSVDVLRMHHYVEMPVAAVADDRLGMGAHTDDGIVTILWADPVVGLQVLDPAGGWRSVVPPPGVLVVNVGDRLARWTDDRWRSAPHRVVAPIDGRGRSLRRRSVALFHGGNADADAAALPTRRAAS